MPIQLSRQRGISLIVTLLITVLLSLLALYGAGVLVLDTRSAGNDYRYREAMNAGESGIEQGISLLNANRKRIDENGFDADNDGTVEAGTGDADVDGTIEPLGGEWTEQWTTCTSTAAPCLPIRSGDRTNWQYLTINSALTSQPGAGGFELYLLTPTNGGSSRLVYNIVALGYSADSIAASPTTVTIKQGAYFYPLLLGNVKTPIAAASNIPLSGNYSIVTNNNGGGTGVAVTAWSGNTISTGGSFARCYKEEFDDNGGTCPSDSDLLKYVGPETCDDDLCGNDPNFPADLFKFLFGVTAPNYQLIKDQATVLADCSTLDENSSGLIWVTGSCNLPNNDVGSVGDPVLLVVEGGIQANGTYNFYGLIYLFKYPAPGTMPTILFNGNYHVHGGVFVHNTLTLTLNGSFVLEYDQDVLANLKNSPSGRALARIPGSWSDVQLPL